MNIGNTNPYVYSVRAKATLQGTTLLQAENINDEDISKEVSHLFQINYYLQIISIKRKILYN